MGTVILEVCIRPTWKRFVAPKFNFVHQRKSVVLVSVVRLLLNVAAWEFSAGLVGGWGPVQLDCGCLSIQRHRSNVGIATEHSICSGIPSTIDSWVNASAYHSVVVIDRDPICFTTE